VCGSPKIWNRNLLLIVFLVIDTKKGETLDLTLIFIALQSCIKILKPLIQYHLAVAWFQVNTIFVPAATEAGTDPVLTVPPAMVRAVIAWVNVKFTCAPSPAAVGKVMVNAARPPDGLTIRE
jgi:hypothetical protein